jgi:hypothetical protein
VQMNKLHFGVSCWLYMDSNHAVSYMSPCKASRSIWGDLEKADSLRCSTERGTELTLNTPLH